MNKPHTTRRRDGLVSLLPALLLSACAGSSAAHPTQVSVPEAARLACPLPDGGVAIAASARRNAPAPGMTPKVRAVLDHALDAGSHLTLLDTDSAPSVVEEGDLKLTGQNAQALADERIGKSAQLATTLRGSRADAPQADTLGALETAARAVHALGPTGVVVLMDSGLQTRGALRYQSDGLLLATGQDVVAHLRSEGQLPDLQGVTVVLSGLGDTSPPQDRLDGASRNRLIDQWTSIAKASGAACVEVDSQPLTQAAPAGLPAVDTVPVPAPSNVSLHKDSPVALRENTVGFQDDSAQLRDEATARASLKALAAQLKSANDHILLIGTTATAGTERGRHDLSLRRAEAVKRLLVDLGVRADHIGTKGVGVHYPAHVDDLDAKGNLVPALAVRNRAVFVIVKR